MNNVPNHPTTPRGSDADLFRAGYVVAMTLAVSRVEHLLTETELVFRQLQAALADRQREGGQS